MEEQDNLQDTSMPEEDEQVNLTEADSHLIHTDQGDVEVKSLLDKYTEGRLNIHPFFQRRFVWDAGKSSRLIESAIMRVPLPAIYLFEGEDDTTSVIDGQQRLTAFFSFISGKFALSGINPDLNNLNGKTYIELSKRQRTLISECKLRQILFLRDSNENLKFEIFKRLNSGSISLNDQEMRNCVYHGAYNDLLCELAKDDTFRSIMGYVGDHKRMKDVEYVLRFATLLFQSYLRYRPPMKTFMDEEMKERQKISNDKAKELRTKFSRAVASSLTVFGENSFRRWGSSPDGNHPESKTFNASLYDVIMWSFTQYDQNMITRNGDAIREAMIHLTSSNSEFIDAITRSTSAKRQINKRFDIWRQTLSDILSQEEHSPRCFSRKLKQEYYDNNPTCKLCGNRINHIDDAAMDHIEQYWLGGKTVPENARLVHRNCNATRPRKE